MTHTLETDWIDGRIAVVSFSDAPRRNQMSWAAVDELGALLQAHREAGARVVILASALAGHWLQHAWLQDLSNSVESLPLTGSGAGWFSILDEVTHVDMVSIAAISGDTSGGGAEIGWACDFRVAEQQVMFSQPEVNIGLTTGIGGCTRLANLAGRTMATEMVLTGRAMPAQRLYDLGAINRVVASGEALASAVELARELADMPPLAVRGLKKILSCSEQVPLREALENEQTVFQSVVASDDARRGMRSTQARYDAEAAEQKRDQDTV